MPWWAWLIIIGVVLLVALILGFVWGRKRSPALVDRKALEDSERKLLEQQAAAHRTAKEQLAQAAAQLQLERRRIQEWYDANKESIDEGARTQYEQLKENESALDLRLDQLLGLAPKDSLPPDRTVGGGQESPPQDG